MTEPKAAAPVFLVTNDDGYHAPGILALIEALCPLGRVVAVAPDRELSGVGHHLTLNHPLRIREEREDFYIVDGTPTDCVNLGALKILDRMPDFVVSGVNRGANLGDDVTYSGTVAGAMEGALLGIPSMAVSLVVQRDAPDEARTSFAEAAAIAAKLLAHLLGRRLPDRTFLNVNIPGRKPISGMAVTRQGRRNYAGSIVEKTDPRSRAYYWIGGEPVWIEEEGSDQVLVARGFASITPLMLDLTHHAYMADLGALLSDLDIGAAGAPPAPPPQRGPSLA